MQQDLQKQSALSEKARIKKRKSIQEEIVKLQQKTLEFQKEIQAQENKLKRPILEKVRKVIETISKKVVTIWFLKSVLHLFMLKSYRHHYPSCKSFDK